MISHPGRIDCSLTISLSNLLNRLRFTALPSLLVTENPYLLSFNPLGNTFITIRSSKYVLPCWYIEAYCALLARVSSLRMKIRSNWSQSPSPLKASRPKNSSPLSGSHSSQKAQFAFPGNSLRLVGALWHLVSLRRRLVQAYSTRPPSMARCVG